MAEYLIKHAKNADKNRKKKEKEINANMVIKNIPVNFVVVMEFVNIINKNPNVKKDVEEDHYAFMGKLNLHVKKDVEEDRYVLMGKLNLDVRKDVEEEVIVSMEVEDLYVKKVVEVENYANIIEKKEYAKKGIVEDLQFVNTT